MWQFHNKSIIQQSFQQCSDFVQVLLLYIQFKHDQELSIRRNTTSYIIYNLNVQMISVELSL